MTCDTKSRVDGRLSSAGRPSFQFAISNIRLPFFSTHAERKNCRTAGWLDDDQQCNAMYESRAVFSSCLALSVYCLTSSSPPPSPPVLSAPPPPFLPSSPPSSFPSESPENERLESINPPPSSHLNPLYLPESPPRFPPSSPLPARTSNTPTIPPIITPLNQSPHRVVRPDLPTSRPPDPPVWDAFLSGARAAGVCRPWGFQLQASSLLCLSRMPAV